MPNNTEVNTNAQYSYVSGDRYKLEVKVNRTGTTGAPVSQPIHLVVDWEDVENKPQLPEGDLVFNNRFEFPSVGQSNIIYIAIDENRVYRWDSKNMIYRIIGADWNEIEVIDCGGASK